MAQGEANTHFSKIKGSWQTRTSDIQNPNIGDIYYDTNRNYLCRWSGSNWLIIPFTSTSTSSTTSTSTSVTTSTSLTTTSTSSSITTSTSTSTTTTA